MINKSSPSRTCRVCGVTSTDLAAVFCRHPQCRYGYNTICLACEHRRRTRYYRTHRRQAIRRAADWRSIKTRELPERLASGVGQTKTCTGCHAAKPADRAHFPVDAPGVYGLSALCRACGNAATTARSRAHPILTKRRAAVQYRRHHAKRLAANARRYRASKADPVRWAANLAYQREWAHRHAKQRTDISRAYRRAHPEKAAAIKHRRRAREVNAPGAFTGAEFSALLTLQRWGCAYCGVSLRTGYSVDHKMPLSRGGGNDIGNIAAACPRCNSRKGTKTAEEFMASRVGVG